MPLTTDEKLLTLSRNAIDAFDKVDGGVHPGFRPAHAKGILLTGTFTPSKEATSLTRAPHIQGPSTPVTVRLSDFAGIPTVPDNDQQNASPRGCAIRFHLDEHVHTDIVAHSVDNFPSRTAEDFVDFLNALIATDPAGPHPNVIEQFSSARIPRPSPSCRPRSPSRPASQKSRFSLSLLSSSPTLAASANTAATASSRWLAMNTWTMQQRPQKHPTSSSTT
jgi:catalase